MIIEKTTKDYLPVNFIQMDLKEDLSSTEYLEKMQNLAKEIETFIEKNGAQSPNSENIPSEIQEELANLTQKAHELISAHPVLNSTKAKEIFTEMENHFEALSNVIKEERKSNSQKFQGSTIVLPDELREKEKQLLIIKAGIEEFGNIIKFQEDPFSESTKFPLLDLYNSLSKLIDLGFLKGFPLEDDF